jgi:hypothetical protein
MSARAFLVGDLRLEVDASLANGAAVDLLRDFRAAPDVPPTVVLVPAPAGALLDRPGARESFFHGPLRVSCDHGAFLLRDGANALTVSADGRRIEVARLGSAADGASELALLVGIVVALRHHGLFHLHAAALEEEGGRRVLVAGTSGAGKTTLALALAAAGLAPLADDAVLLTRRRGPPRVVGFPRPFHLGERTAAAFPELADHLGPPAATGKRALDTRAALGVHARGEMALPDVLLLPEIAPAARTTVEPVSTAEAFCALVECGALVVADGMPAVPEQLALLRALADAASAARVRLGEDVLRDPAACALETLAACSAARAA